MVREFLEELGMWILCTCISFRRSLAGVALSVRARREGSYGVVCVLRIWYVQVKWRSKKRAECEGTLSKVVLANGNKRLWSIRQWRGTEEMGTQEISWRVYTPSGLLLPQAPGQRTVHPYRASEIHTCPQERAKCRHLYTSILSRASSNRLGTHT